MPPPRAATISSRLASPKEQARVPRPHHPGREAAQRLGPAERSAAAVSRSTYYKALTLKVDRERFTKLKALGVQRDLRSQALMTEALDLLFAKHEL